MGETRVEYRLVSPSGDITTTWVEDSDERIVDWMVCYATHNDGWELEHREYRD